ARQGGAIAGAAGEIEHPAAARDLRGANEIALPDPMDAQAHQVVHQVVVAGHRGDPLAHQPALVGHGHLAVAEMGGAWLVGCAHARINAPPCVPRAWSRPVRGRLRPGACEATIGQGTGLPAIAAPPPATRYRGGDDVTENPHARPAEHPRSEERRVGTESRGPRAAEAHSWS